MMTEESNERWNDWSKSGNDNKLSGALQVLKDHAQGAGFFAA